MWVRRFEAALMALALGFAAGLLWAAASARAEVPCMRAEAMLGEIAGPRYREAPLFDGTMVTSGGEVAVTVLANPRTGTWTMTISPRPGVACVILAGKGFRPARPLQAGPELLG